MANVHDVASVFGWPKWHQLTLPEAEGVLRDVALIADEEGDPHDEPDDIAAARILRQRIGGVEALKSYARTLVPGSNPGGFRRRRVRSPKAFAKGSLRTIRTSKTTRRVIGCPKGKYDPKRKRCKVGTKTQALLRFNPGVLFLLRPLTGKSRLVGRAKTTRKAAQAIGRVLANCFREPIGVQFRRNPTLVHQRLVSRPTFHLLGHAGRPLADLYGVNLEQAKKVAQVIADAQGVPVDVKPSAGSALGAAQAVQAISRARPRRANPATAAELQQAARTFQKWHGFNPSQVTAISGQRRVPRTLVALGTVPEIVYESDKWTGRKTTYVHKTSRPRPVLATGSDGKGLYLVGGRVRVTRDGLVD